MIIRKVQLLLCGGLLILGGCAKPLEATMTQGDINSSTALFDSVEELSFSTIADVAGRSDTAVFSGYTTSGDVDGDGVLSDLTMTVDFGAGDIPNAALSNINVIEGGTPTQTLTGTLTGSGTIDGSDISVSLNGEVSGVKYGVRGTANGNVDLDGSFRNDQAIADAIIGNLTGELAGKFVVDLDGSFVLAEE